MKNSTSFIVVNKEFDVTVRDQGEERLESFLSGVVEIYSNDGAQPSASANKCPKIARDVHHARGSHPSDCDI